MKRPFLMVLAAWGAIAAGLAAPALGQAEGGAAPRKLALLVGISQYERQPERRQPPDWWNLSSHADIKAIRNVLKARFGFQDKDIRVLENHEATCDGVIQAFEEHLIGQARPGDVAYFHYSGHGQQILDDNDDEFDGLDESFVTSNYISQSADDGAKTNLRDDLLGGLLKRLHAKMLVDGKVRGDIVVTLDSCFSGTATRGLTPEDLHSGGKGRLPQRGHAWLESDGPKPSPKSRGLADEGRGLLPDGEADAQGYVLITASSYDQLASEWPSPNGGQMGAFTAAFVTELEQATPASTYRSIFERVSTVVASRTKQNPQIEGQADAQLFSGAALPRASYFVVSGAEGDLLTIPAGNVHGILEGSLFKVFPPGANVKDGSLSIADAEVVTVRGSQSELALTKDLQGSISPDQLLGARVVEWKRPYNTSTLKLLIDPDVPPHLLGDLSKLRMYSTEDVQPSNFDVRIRLVGQDAKKALEFEHASGVFHRVDASAANVVQQVRTTLENEFRSRFLKQLHNPDDEPLVQVDVRVVPADVTLDHQGRLLKASRKPDYSDEAGRTLAQVSDGEYLMLEVRNRSDRLPIYITVLHFPPEGGVYCLFPDREDNRFEPDGKWVSLGKRYVFRAEALRDEAGEPLGAPAVDFFKVIATMEPSNYRDILPPRSGRQRSVNSVRGNVSKHASRQRGEAASAYDLGRWLGRATLGVDPDPDNSHQRSQTVPVVVTDWNTSDMRVETRPKSLR